MPPNVQSPVRIPTSMALLDAGPNGQPCYMRETSRRRIFVQVDTGNVLGLELDRDEKVHSVKKKVQAALCVPTEQCSLVFGDQELHNDLSQVRNDSPLLLARGLHRSSSTPCLSPTSEVSKPKTWSRPIELLGGMDHCYTIRKLIRASVKALEVGVDPVQASGGLGGAYFFKNRRGEHIALVKPTDEEPFAPNNPKGFVGKVLGQPGLKRSVRVGETGVREVAAYLLDHEHFAKVPATALVKVTHSVFNVNSDPTMRMLKGENGTPVAKIASFQQFVQHDYDANDHGTSCFPVSSVHRIGILDVRIFNTDRHAGNILVRKNGNGRRVFEKRYVGMEETVELIPIDHGLCLPETMEDPYFEWLHWPQASLTFSEDELRYIDKLDPYKDAEMLRENLPMLREACLRMLILSTTFLKMGASAGLCLADIGTMMSRQLSGVDEEASEFETLCMLSKFEVENLLEDSSVEVEQGIADPFSEELLIQKFQFHMDLGEPWDGIPDSPNMLFALSPRFSEPTRYASPSALSPKSSLYMYNDPLTFRNKLQPLEEMSEESAISMNHVSSSNHFHPYGHENSGPMRCLSYVGGKHQFHGQSNARKIGNAYGKFVRSRSDPTHVLRKNCNAHLTFLSDMSESTWKLFVDHFQELLQVALINRKGKVSNISQKFGTSCQF